MSELLRSMLYVPANSWRMITNATTEGADAVILDLEDGCPMAEKETGRIFARDAIPQLKEQGVHVYVRVNAMETGLSETDIQTVVGRGLDGIILAKTESARQVIEAAELILVAERHCDMTAGSVALLPLLETPLGVLDARQIIAASERVQAVGFGAGDFSREMGAGMGVTNVSPDENFLMVLQARSTIAMSARAAGVQAIDTPFFGLVIDLEGLARETERVKLLGFSGKQLTHPRHVETANHVFTPTPQDVELARQVVAAYNEAQAKGLGATTLNGKMIDFGSFKRAEALLERADQIEAKTAGRLAS